VSILQQNRVRRSRLRGANPIVIMLVVAVVFSAVVAAIWQISSPPPAEPPPPIVDPSLLPAGSQTPPQDPPPDSAAPQPSGAEETSSSAEPRESAAPAGAVARQTRATSEYFDDAAFVGDSITTGIKLYDIMANADVFAGVGVSLENILTKEAVAAGDRMLTIPQALESSAPAKIYIMLGANSLGGKTERAIELYGRLIDTVVLQHPDSLIYIQSVLPIHEPIFQAKYTSAVTNRHIDAFNEQLCALTAEKGVFYLDVASIFKDETGAMPSEYTPDGIHINSAQYVMWFDYLKEHAVPVAE
jgi:lysophospholipase L1-like esterase